MQSIMFSRYRIRILFFFFVFLPLLFLRMCVEWVTRTSNDDDDDLYDENFYLMTKQKTGIFWIAIKCILIFCYCVCLSFRFHKCVIRGRARLHTYTHTGRQASRQRDWKCQWATWVCQQILYESCDIHKFLSNVFLFLCL